MLEFLAGFVAGVATLWLGCSFWFFAFARVKCAADIKFERERMEELRKLPEVAP